MINKMLHHNCTAQIVAQATETFLRDGIVQAFNWGPIWQSIGNCEHVVISTEYLLPGVKSVIRQTNASTFLVKLHVFWTQSALAVTMKKVAFDTHSVMCTLNPEVEKASIVTPEDISTEKKMQSFLIKHSFVEKINFELHLCIKKHILSCSDLIVIFYKLETKNLENAIWINDYNFLSLMTDEFMYTCYKVMRISYVYKV